MKRNAAGTNWTTLVVMAVAASAIVGGWWYFQTHSGPWRPALGPREIATRVLAEYLSARYPQSKALVMANPFAQRSGQSPEVYAFNKAGLRGLEQGFKTPDRIKIVYPELRPEFGKNPQSVYVDPKTTTPLSFLVADNTFDQAAQANPDFGLIVSLIGLPVNIPRSAGWRIPDKPRFALLLPDWRMVGDQEAVWQAIKSGKIAAAVINRPGSPTEDIPIQGDYKSEFDRRFLLVTPENIDQLLQSHPRLF